MHVTEKKKKKKRQYGIRVSLLSWYVKYLTCYGALFSDWSSTAVKCKGKKIKHKKGNVLKSKLICVIMTDRQIDSW